MRRIFAIALWKAILIHNTAAFIVEKVGGLGRVNQVSLHNALKIDVEENDGLTYDKDGPKVIFKAQKEARIAVTEEEGARSLLSYLALPAEKYSVLDAGSIQRIPDSNSFICELDPINFLGSTIVAKIQANVDVSPYPEGLSVIEGGL